MRPVRVLLLVAALVAAVMVGLWAGRVALEPPEDPLAVAGEPTSYVVAEGSVGRSLTFTATAEWDLVPFGQNAAGGVVTSVEVEPGEMVTAGDVLFTVGLRPVVVAVGSVPMFRSLAVETEGPDVAQLQQLLSELGHFGGEVDGLFYSATRTAVRAWQEELGVASTGVVEVGDIVFVPELPVPVVLNEAVFAGARLAGGEPAVQAILADPVFRIPLSIEQADLVPLSADVSVTYPDGVWPARIDRAVERVEFGQLDLFLTALDGTSVCGDECRRWVQLTDRTDFRAEVVVIPETTGPVVPVGAISVGAGNEALLNMADGSVREVRVVKSANGLAVVEGVEVGAEILLPVQVP
jgi:hypothetical protein